jgi:hypothetical protein
MYDSNGSNLNSEIKHRGMVHLEPHDPYNQADNHSHAATP